MHNMGLTKGDRNARFHYMHTLNRYMYIELTVRAFCDIKVRILNHHLLRSALHSSHMT